MVLALAPPAGAQLSVLDDGTIRVAVDLDRGGAIGGLERSQGIVENLVADSEQAYSFGYGLQQATARLVAQRNDGRTIYVRSHSEDCGCTYETWVSLAGPVAHVRDRVTSERWSAFPPSWQETPPVYSGAANTRVVTFTNGRVRDVSADASYPLFQGQQHLEIHTPEHWVALVDGTRRGVGLVEPDLSQFIALSQPYESYVAGVRYEVVDQNLSYTYAYDLVVGTVAQIRAYARAHSVDARPNFQFVHDRQHVTFENAHDLGLPIDGALRLRLDAPNGDLVGPYAPFDAARVPSLYVRGAWSSSARAKLLWDGGSKPFQPIGDGRFHTYRIRPAWSGTVTTLRLAPGAAADVTCISWKPCPVDRKAEARLLASPDVPYLDAFDTLAAWTVDGNSTGATTTLDNGVVRSTVAGDAKPLPGQTFVTTGLSLRCYLAGNFDTQIDYRLEEWPAGNDVHVAFGLPYFILYRTDETGPDVVNLWEPPILTTQPDDRPQGSLRFVRQGVTALAYFLNGDGAWQYLGRAKVGVLPLAVSFSLLTNRTADTQDVTVLFDNFRVTAGRFECPAH